MERAPGYPTRGRLQMTEMVGDMTAIAVGWRSGLSLRWPRGAGAAVGRGGAAHQADFRRAGGSLAQLAPLINHAPTHHPSSARQRTGRPHHELDHEDCELLRGGSAGGGAGLVLLVPLTWHCQPPDLSSGSVQCARSMSSPAGRRRSAACMPAFFAAHAATSRTAASSRDVHHAGARRFCRRRASLQLRLHHLRLQLQRERCWARAGVQSCRCRQPAHRASARRVPSAPTRPSRFCSARSPSIVRRSTHCRWRSRSSMRCACRHDRRRRLATPHLSARWALRPSTGQPSSRRAARHSPLR